MKKISGKIKLFIDDRLIDTQSYSSKSKRNEILLKWNRLYGYKNKYHYIDIVPYIR